MHYDTHYTGGVGARFTQPDTIIPDPKNPQDLNRYSYVRGNPVNYTDPSGHCSMAMVDEYGGVTCDFYTDSGLLSTYTDADGHTTTNSRSTYAPGPWEPPRGPTDPACAAEPLYCATQPGSSGLGVAAEIDAIATLEALPADDFYELASDPAAIEAVGLGFLDFSNDGCSKSPDSIGGVSFLGPCAQHDFSYRNRKAYEAYTGDNIFSKDARRDADDRLEHALETACDGHRCRFVNEIYWVFVHGYGDGWGNLLPWDGVVPG